MRRAWRSSAPSCGATGDGFVSPDLGSAVGGVKSGYVIAIDGTVGNAGPNDCNGTASRSAYLATATPVTVGMTGGRSFITSEASTIYRHRDGAGREGDGRGHDSGQRHSVGRSGGRLAKPARARGLS